MLTDQKSCLNCNKPLTTLQSRLESVCSAACAWKYRTVPETQRCAICARVLAVAEFARRTCANDACQRAWLYERPSALKRKQRELMEVSARAWRNQCADTIGMADAASFPVTLVPYNYAVENELPAARREALREHLTRMAQKALAFRQATTVDSIAPDAVAGISDARNTSPTLPEPPSRDLGAMMVNACIVCRGSCCRSGGEHAYITPDTIVRYLDTHSGASEGDIVQQYMAHLVSRTMDSGCVYQHETGCVLPRDMRSDTCNRYYCESLSVFRENQTDDSPMRAFFVPVNDGRFDQGVFAAPGFVQIVRTRDIPQPATS